MSDTPLFPEGMGHILAAVLAPPSSDDPPYTHTFAFPEPPEAVAEPVLSRRDRERFARRIARIFDVPLWIAGIGSPPSRVANAVYRQRQKNRVKRRRR